MSAGHSVPSPIRWPLTVGARVLILNAVGQPAHSAYFNRVSMAVSSPHVDKEGEGMVTITGHLAYGD